MGHPTDAVRDVLRVLRNAPVAVSVASRHLVQGGDHARDVTTRLLGRLPNRLPGRIAGHAPSRRRALGRHAGGHERARELRAALDAFGSGELSEAVRHARAAGGVRGRVLASYVEGERALASPAARASTGSTGAVARPAGGRPERVLHLVTNALPEVVAGYTVRTQGIAAAQREAGIDAHVVTRLGFPVSKGHLRAAAYVEVDGVPHHRTLEPVPLRRDRALARDVERTTRLAERLRPDVLHAHSNHLNGQVALAVGRRLGIPVVYEVRGFIEETRRSDEGEGRRSELWRLTREAETWCMTHADAVVTLGETMRQELLARGIAPERVTVSPNAVPTGLIDEHAAGSEELAGAVDRRGLLPDVPADALVVGVVGTLNPYEGVDVLVRAVGMLDGVHLVLVGDGPARAELEALASGLPVTFVGRVPVTEVARWHASLDVYCVPRVDLPVTRLVPPLKPVEAMAAGRPVVASDLPPLRELVRDGETGLLVAPGDPAALAGALARLAADPELRRKLGAAGRAEVALTRTWSAAADRYTDLYTRLLDGTAMHQPMEPPPAEGAPA